MASGQSRHDANQTRREAVAQSVTMSSRGPAYHLPVTTNFADSRHPWRVSVSGTTLRFSDCWVMVGMSFIDLGSIDLDVSLAASGNFVGLVYDSNVDDLGDALSLAVGGDGAAYDSNFDPDSQYVRFPLCELRVVSGVVSVTAMSMGIPHFMVYKATA